MLQNISLKGLTIFQCLYQTSLFGIKTHFLCVSYIIEKYCFLHAHTEEDFDIVLTYNELGTLDIVLGVLLKSCDLANPYLNHRDFFNHIFNFKHFFKSFYMFYIYTT